MSRVIRLAEAEVDRVIARTTRGLAAARGENIEQVARGAGMAPSSLYRKLDGVTAFKAAEVAALARHLGCSVADLYDGLGGRLLPPTEPPAGAVARPSFG